MSGLEDKFPILKEVIGKHATNVLSNTRDTLLVIAEESLAALKACLDMKTLSQAYGTQLRNPNEWPEVAFELMVGAMFVRKGADVLPHVLLPATSRNFDYLVTFGEYRFNTEVKMASFHLKYVSDEYESRLKEELRIPCGLTVSFRGFPHVAEAPSLARTINQLYTASRDQVDIHLGQKRYRIFRNSKDETEIWFTNGEVVESITFHEDEPPDDILVISGSASSMVDPHITKEFGLPPPEPYEERPFHCKLRDVISGACEQLPSSGLNVVALVGIAYPDYHYKVQYAMFGDPVIAYPRNGREHIDKLVPDGICQDVVYESTRQKLTCVLSVDIKSPQEPTYKVFSCVPSDFTKWLNAFVSS